MEVSGGSVDALTDDILADILVRLDAVSVLRCRAVCKSWRRIATDRSFLAAHAAARPREMIIKTKHGYARSTVPLPPPDDDDDIVTATLTAAGGDDDDHRHHHHRYLFDHRPPPADGKGRSPEFVLHASLDGLLLLEHWRKRSSSGRWLSTYVICNPVTRQWAKLASPFAAVPAVPRRGGALAPVSRTDVVCGFYFHAASGEYRLLLHCATGASPRELEHYYCCVVSVGSAHMPRRLAHAPPSDELYPHYDDPVCYRGTLHWLSGHPQGRSTGIMLAFDTASEAFRLMPRPPPAEGPEAMTDLLELDGELSVATMYRNGDGGTMLDVWALQDYTAEKWTLRHRLNAQRPPRSTAFIMTMGDAPCGSSSAILVGLPRTGAVMVYSLKDNKVRRKIDFGGYVSFKVFSESLVPHAFFDSPETVPLKFSNPFFNESRGRSA